MRGHKADRQLPQRPAGYQPPRCIVCNNTAVQLAVQQPDRIERQGRNAAWLYDKPFVKPTRLWVFLCAEPVCNARADAKGYRLRVPFSH